MRKTRVLWIGYSRVHEDVGNVSVAEDLSGIETEDGCLGTARVGTADPENLRGLAFSHGLEEGRVGLGHGAAPEGVVVEGLGVGIFIAVGVFCRSEVVSTVVSDCWLCVATTLVNGT